MFFLNPCNCLNGAMRKTLLGVWEVLSHGIGFVNSQFCDLEQDPQLSCSYFSFKKLGNWSHCLPSFAFSYSQIVNL